MDCPTSAEALLIEAAAAYALRRCGPGCQPRRIVVWLDGPDGVGQEIALDPVAYYLRQARQQAAPAAQAPAPSERAPEQALSEAEQAVLEALSDRPHTCAQLAELSGYSPGYLRQVLPALVRRGLVERTGRGYRRPSARSGG